MSSFSKTPAALAPALAVLTAPAAPAALAQATGDAAEGRKVT